ncbi:MAG: chromate transporter [Caldicoprobacterales bacterium]|jgi:chromate transporter|nr:chromate transporter [Clostridiales bacterium]
MDKKILKKSLKLFTVFFRIGAFTFGGGYAMIPYIEREIVDKNKWIKSEEIIDIFAIVQSVPGVIAVNSSTFVGYRIAGLTGSIAATLGVVLPSYIIIAVIALFLYNFKEYPLVNEAFHGIQAGVAALMCYVVYKLGKSSIKNGYGAVLAAASFLALTVFGASAVLVLLAAGVLSLTAFALHSRKAGKGEER